MGERWAAMAAALSAITCYVALSRRRRSAPPGDRRWMEEGPSATLVLEMVAVAVRHGASVSRTLDVVGRVCAGTCGAVPGTFASETIHVARALNRGTEWDSAWGVCDPRGRDVALLGLLHDALTPSWRHGASPLLRIETAIEQVDRDERRCIEEAAAKLSVRVLVPMGLCFLPSFILIGVVPAVVSFAGG